MKKIEKIAKQKVQSREIVKEIINFGVTEDQKIDIIYYLSLTLEDNEKMKNICNSVKKYMTEINKEKSDNKIILP